MKTNQMTIGALARQAGVTHRQLRHYETLGLVPRAERSARGYRVFGPEAAAALAEVLSLRRMGLGLQDIALALATPAQRAARLRAALSRLESEAVERAAQMDGIRAALARIEEENNLKVLYKPHSAAKQRAYETELIRTGPPGIAADIARSKAHAKANPGLIAQTMAELPGIEGALVAAFVAGRAAQGAEVEAHRQWVARMWGRECPPEAYAGLADLYEATPDFRARYQALAPGFGPWLSAAMRDHARALSQS
ncbi:MAG: MerR family transcriptional regulator [Paracoccaceae bacterium]